MFIAQIIIFFYINNLNYNKNNYIFYIKMLNYNKNNNIYNKNYNIFNINTFTC